MPRKQATRYEVGYGRPPVAHQFKKGQSGNPKGRRKGSHSVESLVLKELNETVVVQEGGQRKSITKIEAVVKQVTNKAASGDIRSQRLLLELMNSPAYKAINETVNPSPLVESPRESISRRLDQISRRLKAAEHLQSGITNSGDAVPPE